MSAYMWQWIVWAAVILLVYLFLGIRINKRWVGILIDSRCKMSLSRFQLVLWTWLLISAFLAVAWANRSVAIFLAPEVWALMGISVASAASTVIVNGNKEGKEPSQTASRAINVARVGVLHQNTQADGAKFEDMFKGEEVSNFSHVDIGKVQMFIFTVTAIVGYGAALWGSTFDPKSLAFPPLSEQLVVLLGISHAGYLTIKAAPKTPTEPGGSPGVRGQTARFPGAAPVAPPPPTP